MSFLFLSADDVGIETGGGLVTANELAALRELGDVTVISRKELAGATGDDVWKWDREALRILQSSEKQFDLCHGYAGSFPETTKYLREQGTKICWTIAAHDVAVSRREHEKWIESFPYPHLTDPELWKKYIEGYRLADVIVCPGKVPENTVRNYGPDFANKRIEIIPHGCHLPDVVKPFPKMFTVGYMGSFGCDKGVIYLLQAWKKLNYKDALLVLAGKDSLSAGGMIQQFGGGNIQLIGWVNHIKDFYNTISVFCCPAATEGFNLEVIESMAHGRPVICSDGAGAVDLVESCGAGLDFEACDMNDLAYVIDLFKNEKRLNKWGETASMIAKENTWDKIRQRYIDVWSGLLQPSHVKESQWEEMRSMNTEEVML